jgi:hypothetical protein
MLLFTTYNLVHKFERKIKGVLKKNKLKWRNVEMLSNALLYMKVNLWKRIVISVCLIQNDCIIPNV